MKGKAMDQTDRIESIPVTLANGATIRFQVSQPEAGPMDVADIGALPFKQVTEALREIVAELKETLDRVKPDKASVKFGVEIAAKPGDLTTLIVKGSGKGNLEITLEWGR
jgi:hypothetical protein